MKASYGKPLHRYLTSDGKSGRTLLDPPFWMLQRARFDEPTGKNPSQGSIWLVSTRKSKTLSSLFEYGRISMERFDYAHRQQRAKDVGAALDLSLERFIKFGKSPKNEISRVHYKIEEMENERGRLTVEEIKQARMEKDVE